MIITAVQLEGTSVIKRIDIPEIRQFRRYGYGSFLVDLAIEDLDLVTMGPE
jgi:hypothetical protein